VAPGLIRNVRMTAAPNTCLFDGGMRYLQNSVVVENQTEPYTAAMAQLVTKTDIAGTDTSGGSLSLRMVELTAMCQQASPGIEVNDKIAFNHAGGVVNLSPSPTAAAACAAFRAGASACCPTRVPPPLAPPAWTAGTALAPPWRLGRSRLVANLVRLFSCALKLAATAVARSTR
jgi:hypothetical protein